MERVAARLADAVVGFAKTLTEAGIDVSPALDRIVETVRMLYLSEAKRARDAEAAAKKKPARKKVEEDEE